MTTLSNALVCVVDDDIMVRESLRMLLETLGMRCSAFPDCHSFLNAPELHSCECLILDVRMPGISGTVLQDILRESLAYLPIIFISGHGDIPLAVEAMRKGAVDFMQKPFNEQLLLDRVQKAISLCKQRKFEASKRHDIEVRLASLTPRALPANSTSASRPSNNIVPERCKNWGRKIWPISLSSSLRPPAPKPGKPRKCAGIPPIYPS